MVSIYIRYDEKSIFYRRETYSILDFLADIGGVQQALIMIGALFLPFIARKLYVASIVKELYQTKFMRGGNDSGKENLTSHSHKKIVSI
jgi:hypothetical protein